MKKVMRALYFVGLTTVLSSCTPRDTINQRFIEIGEIPDQTPQVSVSAS